MLRGSLVLFVGLFSVIFLHRRLPLEQWLSLFVVMAGIAVVGLSNALTTPAYAPGDDQDDKKDVTKALLGASLVLFAQIFTASQFVIEEKIMMRYSLAPLVSARPMTHL
jgi:drug/metabolite transporter (DMT)-like permease